jgi:hypothetical protein
MIDYAPEMPSRNIIPGPSSGSDKPYIALILGAGFSKCADLPLQADFSRALLDNIEDDDLNRTITSALQEFLQLTFGWCRSDDLPSLEAIFTLIDVSANTGHNLGFSYPPKKLRALRRLLIYRVFSILDQRYRESKEIEALLKKLLGHGYHPAFVVLNWDIVLERHLENTAQGKYGIDYCVNEFPWDGGEATETGSMVSLIKIHGSSNWVYCDNCRQIFFDRYKKLSLHIKAGVFDDDLLLFNPLWERGKLDGYGRSCPRCGGAIGPHIATFSFRKSFRTNAFTASWAAAEEALTQADRWLFIGYSLPDADYEFAHMLKATELKLAKSEARPKKIGVVVYNDPTAEKKFRTMFGRRNVTVEQKGLAHYVSYGLHRFLA